MAESSASPARLLLVTRNLPPLLGGMERLNFHVAVELRQEFEVFVVGPVGSAAFLPNASQVVEVVHKPLWKFLTIALARVVELARQHRPACILAGSGLTAPLAFIVARVTGARTAVYLHGLDLIAAHPVYRWIWLPFLRRMDLCIVNSRHTESLARCIGIRQERLAVINPGVAAPGPHDPSSAADFRKCHGLGSRKVLLSVGRLTPRKGLLEFIDRALAAITESYPGAILVIIGDEAPDALAGSATGMAKRIEELARRKALEQNIRLLGPCSDAVLSSAYDASDVLVFPVRELPGDVEGFGMVAIEAASHGLPTVAFSVGGIADAVGDGHSGWLVPPGDYSALAERVKQVLADNRRCEVRRKCRDFSRAFEWPRFGGHLRKLISRLISETA